MPIDDAILDQLILDLKTKLDADEKSVNDIRGVLSALSHIQKHEGKTIGDRGTAEPMTDDRRQEIYDKCKPKADLILT